MRPPLLPIAVVAALTAAAVGCGGGGSASGTGGAAGSGATGGAAASGAVGGAATGGASGVGGGSASGGASGAGGGAGTGASFAGMGGGGLGGTTGGASVGGTGGEVTAGTGGRAGRGGSGGTGGAAAAGGAGGSFPAGDEFDGSTLSPAWTVLRPDLADVVVNGGTLSLTPHSGALWYQSSQGVLVYKLVTGDFKATATVHARRASNPNLPPNQFADVGGLMARNPGGTTENYVLGVVGFAEMNQLAVEHKSTTNSKSQYGEAAFTADAELRLCRTGATFTIYYRHPGDTGWPASMSVAPITRADLPATLQVGMVAYTGAPSPDYVSIFDRVTFEPVGAGCDRP